MNIADLHRINELTAENKALREANDTLRSHVEYAALNIRWQDGKYKQLQRENESIRNRAAIAEAKLTNLLALPCRLEATQ